MQKDSKNKSGIHKTFSFNSGLPAILALVILFPAQVRAGEQFGIHERWAPVIYQAAVTEADFITRADYDGDWIGSNNWDNFDDHPKPAYVYYDIKETSTHWFLFYAVFHPRDYTEDCPRSCHENDLEALQIAVRKDGSPYGQLELMECLHHSDITLYTAEDKIAGGFLNVVSPVTFLKGRPVVYIEKYGHGIYGSSTESIYANPAVNDIVRYIYMGEVEKPEGIPDNKVSYALLPIYDTFWKNRDCTTGNRKCFDGIFSYKGAELPSQIDGDDYGRDNANVPWGYGQATGDKMRRGDWFFDPAKTFLFHAGTIYDFSVHYTYNPYLKDLEEMGASFE